ncbi:MAG: D-aminoacyl-tRNA deacylase [Candidatus Baltobacteraceae bacterium]
MRAVVTRVREAAVEVGGETVGAIGGGLLVLLGVARDDDEADARALAERIFGLRIFRDEAGAMNRGLGDAGGSVLVVSQFTLLGDARRGRRPSFVTAAPGEQAERLYESFAGALRRLGAPVETGRFGATMLVRSSNDGPVTILLDSKRAF